MKFMITMHFPHIYRDRPSVMYIPLSRRELQFTNISFKRHLSDLLPLFQVNLYYFHIYIMTKSQIYLPACRHKRLRVWCGDTTMQNRAYYDKHLQKLSLQRMSECYTFSHLHTYMVYNPRKYRFAGRPKGHDSTSTLAIHGVHHLLLAIEMVIYFSFSNDRLNIIIITGLF